MMPGMAPAPDDGLAHHHERGDFVKRVVHPVRLERGAVPGFVPSRIGGRSVKNSVDQIGNNRPPRWPEAIGQVAKTDNQSKPDNGIPDGGTIAPF